MPLLKLKRNWFGPDGQRYRVRDGLHQVSEEVADQAPSDAIVYDDGGKALPSRSPRPMPGHGAKPLEEQILDLIPGGAPMHQTPATGYPPVPLSDRARLEQNEERKEAEEKRLEERAKADEEEKKEEQAKVTEGLALAEKAEANVRDATDPVQSAAVSKTATTSGQASAPKK